MAELESPAFGTFVVELVEDEDADSIVEMLRESGIGAVKEDIPDEWVVDHDGNGCEILPLGETTDDYVMATVDEEVDLVQIQEVWESGIEGVFPYRTSKEEAVKLPTVEVVSFDGVAPAVYSGSKIARPRVIIPVFPGTNCEYDTLAAFERAGAEVTTQIINNMTPSDVHESTDELVRNIKNSQIVMLPGGFSGGDEPDGSAKFITAFFRSPAVTEAVRDLLQNRDGLMLGICNGFQALVKLGLVPYGDIVDPTPDSPTLTFNNIGRHQSRLVDTRVCSSLSPWLSKCNVGDINTVAISHGEGRFVASLDMLTSMAAAGQIATQYVDSYGQPSMNLAVNPNGSVWAIEGITSPDGRVLGKMGHSERAGDGLYKNVPGNLYQPIFEGGVSYFS